MFDSFQPTVIISLSDIGMTKRNMNKIVNNFILKTLENYKNTLKERE